MGITCPNKRLKAWRDLVKIQGENKSYALWSEFNGNVPEEYYSTFPEDLEKTQEDYTIEQNEPFEVNKNFNELLNSEIEEKLKKLYPEIKLEYSNNPKWLNDSNVFNQKSQLDNEIQYRLKAIDILLSDKAKQIFAKGKKNNWSLNKILTELAIPKDQKQLLLNLNIADREQLADVDIKKDLVFVSEEGGIGKITKIDNEYVYFINSNGVEDYTTITFFNKNIIPIIRKANNTESSLLTKRLYKLNEIESANRERIINIKEERWHGKSRVFNNELNNYLENNNNIDVIQLLTHIINGKDAYYSNLAKSITPLIKDIKTLKINVTKGTLLDSGGEFIPNLNVINLKLNSSSLNTYLILHELLHAIAYNSLKNKDIFGDNSNNFVDSLNRLYNDLKKYDFANQYGFENVDEFISEIFTNKNFQEILANIEYDKKTKQSVLDYIIKLFSDLLNIKYVKNSALEISFNILSDYIKGEKTKFENLNKEIIIPTFNLREQLALEVANKYGFSIEINTATDKIKFLGINQEFGISDGEYFTVNGVKYSYDPYNVENERYSAGNRYIDKEEYEEAKLNADNIEIPTQHYSNLTVPGGINYTENEISTPLITPNIKGHPKFATDKGIGWFRSDELGINPKQKEYSQQDFDSNSVDIGSETIQFEGSKTRRILEIQSDLFQNIRNNFNVKGNNYTKSTDKDSNPTYFLNGKSISKSEYEKGWNEYLDTAENSEDAFLKLLLRNDNWITFFIKSIIQDSAKKGYEKLLFPKGETAAKIEGHETIAELIKRIDIEIESIKKGRLGFDKTELGKEKEVKTGQKIEDILFAQRPESNRVKEFEQKGYITNVRIDVDTAKLEAKEKEKANLKSQGIEKLKPVEAFYEIKIGNILEKQFGKENIKTITDRYGNQWREITINQSRDLDNVLLQRDEANKIIGQANIKALTVLIDAVNMRQDTLPHEYAHHYIAWYRNTPLVQEAIKKWGSEEALVQSIGEQAVIQKGDAWNWWKKFVNWLLGDFKKLSKLDRDQLTKILTDAFLTRQDLSQISKPTNDINKSDDFIPKDENIELYRSFNLLDSNNKLISYKTEKEGKSRVDGLNKSSTMYNFKLRKTSDGRYRILIVKNKLFSLEREKKIARTKLEEKLIKTLMDDYGVSVEEYERIIDRLDVHPEGFTELANGSAKIVLRKDRDGFTLLEEAGHVFFAMLYTTPYYSRMIELLGTGDYYKQVLGENYDIYYKEYKGDIEKLKIEAAGQLIGKAFLSQEIPVPEKYKTFLQKVWETIQRLIKKFPTYMVENELKILSGEIAKQVTDNKFEGKLENIRYMGTLYRVTNKLDNQKELINRTLESVLKRLQHFRRVNDKESESKYMELQKTLIDKIDKVEYLEGINEYLKTLDTESSDFSNRIIEFTKDINEKFEAYTIKRFASGLKKMKMVVDANIHTLDDIVTQLSEEIRYNPELADEYDSLIKSAQGLYLKFKDASSAYYDLGTTLVSEFLKPLLGNRNNKDLIDSVNLTRRGKKLLKRLNIEDALKTTEGDINFVTRWLDALAETPDDVVKLLDIAVKNQKIIANRKSLEDRKKLIDLERTLNAAGVKETSWIAEQDKDGNNTGYIITESNWGEWHDIRDNFFKSLNEEIKAETGIENYLELKKYGTDKKIVNKYKKKVAKFYNQYTYSDIDNLFDEMGPLSELSKHLTEKKKELGNFYETWKYFNTQIDNYTGKVTVLKKVNPKYKEITSSPAKFEFYKGVLDIKYDIDRGIPKKLQHARRMPQIRKDFVERVKDAGLKGNIEAFKNLFRQLKDLYNTPDDVDDKGLKFNLSDDSSKPIKFLPLYYIRKLKNMSELSTDITSTMTMYSAMARDYKEMSEIIDVMEIAKDVVGVRIVNQVDSNGNLVMESIKSIKGKMMRNLTQPKGTSMVYDRLQDYFNMVVYGELKKDEGQFGNILDSFSKYVALNSLGFNLFAGIANVNVGAAMENIDAIAGEYFDIKSIGWADVQYTKDLGHIIESIGSLDSKGHITGKNGKINLWIEAMDVLQDYRTSTKEINAARKNIFSRLFNMSTIFFVNHAGEHWMQTRTSLALSHNFRYDTNKGKFVWKNEFYSEISELDLKRRNEINAASQSEMSSINEKYKSLSKELQQKLDEKWEKMTNYYDAHEVDGNRLKLKPEFNMSISDMQKFIHRTNALNKSFHGIYNDIDKSAAQQYALFRLVWQFRKWMIPYWNRRYGKGQFNFEKDAYEEGYYTTFGRFIKNLYKDMKDGNMSLKKNWNTLSEQEKANFKRVMTEVGHILGYSVLAVVLTGLMSGGDDDDEWLLQMTAYQASRAITEIGAMTLPWASTEALKILNSPMAGTNQIKNLSMLLMPWDWFDEIERGSYTGFTKFEKMLIKGTPIAGQLKSLMSPEEKMVYFTTNR